MSKYHPPLAQLHRQVAFGQSNGWIIWQPRIGCWYNDKLFAGIERIRIAGEIVDQYNTKILGGNP